MLKAADLRERSPEDLRELEKTLTRDVFTNRFKNFTNRLDNTSAIRKAKKDLARVKTILAQAAAKAKADAAPVAAPAPVVAPKAKKAAAAPKAAKAAASTPSVAKAAESKPAVAKKTKKTTKSEAK